MIDWAARANTAFLKVKKAATDTTDEIRVSSASSVPSHGTGRKKAWVSSVPSVDVASHSGKPGPSRAIWPDLERSIQQVCDLRGDDPVNRRALLDECRSQAPELQADLLAHFEDMVRMYRAALGRPTGTRR